MANAPKTNADNDYNIGHRARDIQTEKIPNSLAETAVDTGEQSQLSEDKRGTLRAWMISVLTRKCKVLGRRSLVSEC